MAKRLSADEKERLDSLFARAQNRIRGAKQISETEDEIHSWLAQETRPAALFAGVKEAQYEEVREYLVRNARTEAIGPPLMKWALRASREGIVQALRDALAEDVERARTFSLLLLEKSQAGIEREDSYEVAEGLTWLAHFQDVPGAILPEELQYLVEQASERAWQRTGFDARTVVADMLLLFRELDEKAISRLWPIVVNRMDKAGRWRKEDIAKVVALPNVPLTLLRELAGKVWFSDGLQPLIEHPMAVRDEDMLTALLGNKVQGVGTKLAATAKREGVEEEFLSIWTKKRPEEAVSYLEEHEFGAHTLSEETLRNWLQSSAASLRLYAIRKLSQKALVGEPQKETASKGIARKI